MADKFRSGPAFLTHVPCHPRGTDPSHNNQAWGQPTPIRQTVTQTWITRGGGRGLVGRMSANLTPAEATITCTVANVTVGQHLIRVGPFELRPAIDFLVGATDDALATNLAAAIDALPGFVSSANANAVTVNTGSGHGDDVRLEVVETSAASAFAVGALDQAGLMNRGEPAPTAPLLA